MLSGETGMPRNVEIKAKLKDFEKVLRIVADLCQSNGILLNQEDTFFNVPYGRLKLRNFKNGAASQLISYKRLDIKGPKFSDYLMCNIEKYEDILPVLESSLGIVGQIKKKRHLFLYGQTRIHLDQVENLGNFLELEVVLSEEEKFEHGEKIAHELLQKLQIDEADLITGSYIDL